MKKYILYSGVLILAVCDTRAQAEHARLEWCADAVIVEKETKHVGS